MTRIPPMRESHIRYGINPCPTIPARVPKRMNTILKPNIKKSPFKKIFFREFFTITGFLKSTADTPLINPRYAGTNGKVHGARKVKIPATNADIINPKLSGSIPFEALNYYKSIFFLNYFLILWPAFITRFIYSSTVSSGLGASPPSAIARSM